VQPLAAWLVARPQNAVIALAAMLLLPIVQLFSGIFVAFLVLKQGVRLAGIEAVLAAALLTAGSLIVGTPVQSVFAGVLMFWVPAMLLAVTLQKTKSLTLTMQLLVLVFVGAAVVLFGVVGDLAEFAKPLSTLYLEILKASGLHEQAEAMAADPLGLARELVQSTLWGYWMLCVLFMMMGYRLYRKIDGEFLNYGMFRDLDFGRVIAVAMIGTTIVAYATGLDWLKLVAVMMLAPFWLQGLALLHWVYEAGKLPLFLLILIYILLVLPVLNEITIVGLAMFGYSDVWLHFRRRIARNEE